MTRGPARSVAATLATTLATVAAALGVAVATGGCVTQREKTVALLEEGAFAPPEARAALVGGAGDPARGYRRPRSGAAASHERRPAEVAPDGGGDGGVDGGGPAAPPAARAKEPAVRVDPAPVKTSSAPPAHEAVADVATLQRRQRETFLTCTTTIRAEKATLFVPPRYAAEAVLDGTSRLTLRRLTIEARQVKLVLRTDGSDDVSISARGEVSFHADRPASVIAETGLKALLVRNDGYTPLR